jgi:hypothetical protein
MTGNRRDEGTGPGLIKAQTASSAMKALDLLRHRTLDNVHQGEWLNLVVREINGALVLHAKTRLGVEIGAISSRSTGK